MRSLKAIFTLCITRISYFKINSAFFEQDLGGLSCNIPFESLIEKCSKSSVMSLDVISIAPPFNFRSVALLNEKYMPQLAQVKWTPYFKFFHILDQGKILDPFYIRSTISQYSFVERSNQPKRQPFHRADTAWMDLTMFID